jgi:hypothetical protein
MSVVEAPEKPKETLDTWPEGSPSVSMDVELGELGEGIDFDIHAYNKLLEQQGVSPEDREKLHVNFRDFALTYGEFDPEEIKIRTSTSHLSDNDVNKNLLHETRHFTQDLNGDVYDPEGMKRRKKIGKIVGTLGGGALLGATYGIYAAAGLDPAIMYAVPTAPLALIAPGRTGHFAYESHRQQRDARKFAKNPGFPEAKQIFSRRPM